jgi:hypothetical protein
MNRLEWVLGIMLALLLVIVAGLALMFWFRSDEPNVARPANAATEVASFANVVEPTPEISEQTAHLAYVTAQRTAVSWQSDAVLFSAMATWPQGMTAEEIREGEAAWNFTFYSPAAESMALISVAQNEASLIVQGPMEKPADLFDATGWNLDSSDAIDLLLQEGGATFIDEAGITTLTMALTMDAEDGRILWHIQLSASQSLRIMTLSLDATSGEILEVNQTT